MMGWYSILPPVVAIALALFTKRLVIPMLVGVATGAGLLATKQPDSNWLVETSWILGMAIYDSLFNIDHLHVLAFTILIGATIGVLESSQCLRRVIGSVAKHVRTRRGGQTLIGASGLAIFFDDYANTLLIGGTMRSTADRYGISRAKLAYLVDSTAAPVAGLTLISTWVATELSYLESGLAAAGIEQPGMALSMFTQSIPFRFYPIMAIVMVFVIARTGRDFGPMRHAELDAAGQAPTQPAPSETPSAAWQDLVAAFVPVAGVMITVFVVLVFTADSPAVADPPQRKSSNFLFSLGQMIGSGNSYLALVIAGAVGLCLAGTLAWWRDPTASPAITRSALRGGVDMLPAMVILWLAWALSAMTDRDALDTGGFLGSYLGDRVDVRWLPTCVFVLAGFVAFATGTSWGTMALLTPIAVSLAIKMQVTDAANIIDVASPITLATFSGVLAGAIFGDHCSPISDTTVLSSRASGCDHIIHVRTQLPYALTVASACVVLGTIPVGFGVSVWICLLASVLAIGMVVRVLGHQVEPESIASPTDGGEADR
ncbi:MAG: Na+/H+ antiporter NhaC family protein [Planctomycetota bacterium]